MLLLLMLVLIIIGTHRPNLEILRLFPATPVSAQSKDHVGLHPNRPTSLSTTSFEPRVWHSLVYSVKHQTDSRHSRCSSLPLVARLGTNSYEQRVPRGEAHREHRWEALRVHRTLISDPIQVAVTKELEKVCRFKHSCVSINFDVI